MALQHQDLTRKILDTFFSVYNELGHGFLESVYANALSLALRQAGVAIEREKPVTVWFRGQPVGEFRMDLVAQDAVVVEVKSVKALQPVHEAQLLNYLRATELEVGLLLNFGERPEVKRMVFDNARKRHAATSDGAAETQETRGNGTTQTAIEQ